MKKILLLLVLFVLGVSRADGLDFKEEAFVTIPYGTGDDQVQTVFYQLSFHNAPLKVLGVPFQLAIDPEGCLYLDYGGGNDPALVKQIGKGFKILKFSSNGQYLQTIRHDYIGVDYLFDEEGSLYLYSANSSLRGNLQIFDKKGNLLKDRKLGNEHAHLFYENGALVDYKTRYAVLVLKAWKSDKPMVVIPRKEFLEDCFYDSDPFSSGGDQKRFEKNLRHFRSVFFSHFPKPIGTDAPKINALWSHLIGVQKGKIYHFVDYQTDDPESEDHFLAAVANTQGKVLWQSRLFKPAIGGKAAVVDKDGDIYLAVPEKEGLKIIKWVRMVE